MGGVTKEISQVSINKVSYKNAEPDQRGNLHERMKNLLSVISKHKRIPQEVLIAIDQLEVEVECYEPLPSYGQRQWIKPKPQNQKERKVDDK